MSDVKRCAACGKENPVSEMKVCMHNQTHNYVCDSKCMTDFYNPPKKPTAAELEAKVASLEAELARLRAGQERPVPQVCMGCVEQASRIRELEHKMDYYTTPQPSAVPADEQIMAKARELFGWAAGLGGFDDAVRELVLFIDGRRFAPATGQGDDDALLDAFTSPGNGNKARRRAETLAAARPAEVCDVCDGKGYVNVGDGDAQAACPFCDLPLSPTAARQEGKA